MLKHQKKEDNTLPLFSSPLHLNLIIFIQFKNIIGAIKELGAIKRTPLKYSLNIFIFNKDVPPLLINLKLFSGKQTQKEWICFRGERYSPKENESGFRYPFYRQALSFETKRRTTEL